MIIKIEKKIFSFVKKNLGAKKIFFMICVLSLIINFVLLASPVTVPYTFKAGHKISSAEINANFKALEAKINILDATNNGAPVGSIMAYAGKVEDVSGEVEEPIPGWLLCNGSAILKTEYDELFEKIGESWGSDNDDYFNLPDLRGRFLRGLDTTEARDPDYGKRTNNNGLAILGNVVGSYQEDAFQGHWHASQYDRRPRCSGSLGDCDNKDVPGTGEYDNDVVRAPITPPGNTSSYGTVRVSKETRPKNAAVTFIIKYR